MPDSSELVSNPQQQWTIKLGAILVMVLVFVSDLGTPLGVAGGVPYIAVILFALWTENKRFILALAITTSLLTLAGYVLSPPGGVAWVVVTNRLLALFAIWVTATLGITLLQSQKRLARQQREHDLKIQREKEAIYLATMHAVQHITNNLLNQLRLIEMELDGHPHLNAETIETLRQIMQNAEHLLSALATVTHIDSDEIRRSVHPSAKPQ